MFPEQSFHMPDILPDHFLDELHHTTTAGFS
jgi:hypothetical protein